MAISSGQPLSEVQMWDDRTIATAWELIDELEVRLRPEGG